MFNWDDSRWIVAAVLVISVWMGLAPEWYAWYAGPENGLWMKALYRLLDALWLVNVPVAFILGYLTFVWGRRIWIDNDCRIFRPLLLAVGLFVLIYGSKVEYAKIVGQLDYKGYLLLLAVFLLLEMILKTFRILLEKSGWSRRISGSGTKLKTKGVNPNSGIENVGTESDNPEFKHDNNNEKQTKNIQILKSRWEKKTVKDEESALLKPFVVDEVKQEAIPQSIKNYISVLVAKMLSTNLEKEAFAVGITGEWGEGKTTFLNLMKEQMKGKAEIVEFNPWMCRTPEQLTHDFFASLRSQLSFKYSSLAKSIKDYAHNLNLSFVPYSLLGIDIKLPARGTNLFVSKQELSEKFSKLPRPVVVFIDDIDRLERDEVFEVLRLIRNTADLKNTIYVVTYDKEYVVDVLEEKNIKRASSYLEKIFPLEVHMPKVEDYLIWEALLQDIKEQDETNCGMEQKINNAYKNEKRELILRILNNYRKVKRFARLYMLNVSYLKKQVFLDYKAGDLFWLELLQMYDKKTYNVLANEYSRLLYEDDGRLFLQDGIVETMSIGYISYHGDKFWKKETPNILNNLFGINVAVGRKSVCYTENYDNYFVLNVSRFKLSVSEFNQLFQKDTNAEYLVKEWNRENKFFTSVFYHLNQVKVNGLYAEQLRNYIYAILCLGLIYKDDDKSITKLKTLLYRDNYDPESVQTLTMYIDMWIGRKISEWVDIIGLSKFLNKLYLCAEKVIDKYPPFSPELLISNSRIISVLKFILQQCLKEKSELTALDILNENSELSVLFKGCCVLIKIEANGTEIYEQYAFDLIINEFANKKVKPTYQEYDKCFLAMFSDVKYEKGDYSEIFAQTYDEAYESNIKAYFGSHYEEKLNEFKDKCFVPDKSVVVSSLPA